MVSTTSGNMSRHTFPKAPSLTVTVKASTVHLNNETFPGSARDLRSESEAAKGVRVLSICASMVKVRGLFCGCARRPLRTFSVIARGIGSCLLAVIVDQRRALVGPRTPDAAIRMSRKWSLPISLVCLCISDINRTSWTTYSNRPPTCRRNGVSSVLRYGLRLR